MTTVDFETYYDGKCSVSVLGTRAYFEHPDFDAYMVSILDDDFQYVGPPEAAPWGRITGPGSHWISHNASFDECLQRWLVEKGKVPANALPETWDCTADMVAYLGVPRSLKASCKAVLGLDLSKDTRDSMKGKRWEDMTPEFRQEVVDYALDDCVYARKLWDKVSHLWPEMERRLSRQSRASGWRGVPVNEEKLAAAIETLETRLITALDGLPWTSDGEKALSTIALAKACREHGVEPPRSVAVDNEDAEAWLRRYADTPCATWVHAIRNYRSGNTLLKKLHAIKERTFGGRMDFNLKYAGAHTLRWSGGGGVNMQNLPRAPMFGVDVRAIFEAPAGKVFIIADLSQIEPRVLHCLAGDAEFIRRLRADPRADLYDVQARRWEMYSDPAPLKEGSPKIRQTVKTLNIGLGYCMRAGRFAAVTGMPYEQADKWVQFYHRKNPLICRLWETLMGAFIDSEHSADKSFHMALPLRTMRYRQVRSVGGPTCVMNRGDKFLRQRIWPGVLVENLVQAFARDVFATKLLDIEDAGYDITFHVHDEVVVEVEEERAEAALEEIVTIMSRDVTWCAEAGLDLPLNAEGDISKHFKK